MREKKNVSLNKRLEVEKEIETMINVIRKGISKGNKYVSFDLTDGKVTTVFIKMNVEREKMNVQNENKENLNYIG